MPFVMLHAALLGDPARLFPLAQCVQLMCTGLALCYRCPIGIRLSRCFMKMLTGRVPLLSDYAQVDPQVCKGLHVIASATQQQLADMQLTFEPPDGSAFSIPHGECVQPALALQAQLMVKNAGCHAFKL